MASNENPCCSGLEGLLSPRVFKALGDPNRVAILVRLAERCRPCSVSEIAECCPVDLSVVSRHLAVLRDAGICDAHRKGKEVCYFIRADTLVASLRKIADAIESCCLGDVCLARPSHGQEKAGPNDL